MTDCYHLHDYEIETTGDVPLSMKLFVSGMKDANGNWTIEQVRINPNNRGEPDIVAWFSPDQGHDAEFLRNEHETTFPQWYIERFLKRFLMKPGIYEPLCKRLDLEVTRGRARRIA